MRMGVALGVFVMSRLAAADPPEGAFAESHLEYILRAGASWISTDYNLGDAPNPKGFGPAVDAELAWRASHVSLAAFSTLSTLRFHSDVNDQEEDVLADARLTLIDLGWRVSFHADAGARVFIGFGIAAEVSRESGRRTACRCANNYCDPCTSLYQGQPYASWNLAPLAEVHLGVTLGKTGPLSFELLAVAGVSSNPDGYHDDLGSLTTERLAIGGRF